MQDLLILIPIVVMEPIKGGALADPPKEVAKVFKETSPDASLASWAIRYVASLDGIITVHPVARHGSFTKAAEECHISQSAISQQIKSLEEELGIQLIVGMNRKFTLTPAGEHFYIVIPHCGVGTSAATMIYGVPSIPVPHILDQFRICNAVKQYRCSYSSFKIKRSV